MPEVVAVPALHLMTAAQAAAVRLVQMVSVKPVAM